MFSIITKISGAVKGGDDKKTVGGVATDRRNYVMRYLSSLMNTGRYGASSNSVARLNGVS